MADLIGLAKSLMVGTWRAFRALRRRSKRRDILQPRLDVVLPLIRQAIGDAVTRLTQPQAKAIVPSLLASSHVNITAMQPVMAEDTIDECKAANLCQPQPELNVLGHVAGVEITGFEKMRAANEAADRDVIRADQ